MLSYGVCMGGGEGVRGGGGSRWWFLFGGVGGVEVEGYKLERGGEKECKAGRRSKAAWWP